MNIALQTLPSAAVECATLLVAMELSKKRWLIGFQGPTGKLKRRSVAGGEVAALLRLIAEERARLEKKLCSPIKVVSCYEAGYDGFWLDRLLRAHGIENYVIDPSSIAVDRRARSAKTDTIDLDKQARSLLAHLGGDKSVLRLVRVPSAEEEDARRLSRERKRLVSEKTQHLGRIDGLLMTQGVRGFSPAKPGWEERLAKLKTGDGRPLPPRLKAEIARQIERLALVIGMIKEIEAEEARLIAADETSIAARLFKLRSIGLIAATGMADELYCRDFRNRRQVGGYLGLDDCRWQSGNSDRGQGISKAGNPRARALIIELAWLWLRWQPQSALSRWFVALVGNARGRVRRVAIVALARKLAVALWRYVTTGVVPEGALLKA